MPRELRDLAGYNQSVMLSNDIRTGSEHRREKRKIQRNGFKKLHFKI